MIAAYNQSGEAGYGALLLSQDVFPDGPWQIAIQRGSDRQYVTGNSAQPWAGEATFLNLASEVSPDGSLSFATGPEIVDCLDPQEIYRVLLKGQTGDPLKATLKINEIAHSISGSLGNTARPDAGSRSGQKPESPAKPAPAPKPEPAPAPEPAPKPEPSPKPEPAPEPAPERLDLEEPASANSHKYWRIGIIAALVIGCIAWYFLDPRWKDSEEAAPAASAEEQVRQFFRSPDPAPQAAMNLAEKLPNTTQADQDAIYRLYYYAAEKNVPGAALAYGNCLDPSKPAWGSVEKNAKAAWDAYKRAPDKNKGEQAMSALKTWLEDKSRAGNARATQWLREIEN